MDRVRSFVRCLSFAFSLQHAAHAVVNKFTAHMRVARMRICAKSPRALLMIDNDLKRASEGEFVRVVNI
jgi:hypothetical protein